jgi:hypothetical protein
MNRSGWLRAGLVLYLGATALVGVWAAGWPLPLLALARRRHGPDHIVEEAPAAQR